MRLRIATFNLENFDDKPNEKPTLDERIALMRPQLLRLDADVICLQEANGQEQAGQPRQLLALDKLLAGTQYAGFNRISTMTGGQVYDERNLVILSRFEILESKQHKPEGEPEYRRITADPPDTAAVPVLWERPILYAKLKLGAAQSLHVLNLHMKSKIPTDIPGQKLGRFTWKSAAGFAEGMFISSMKRVGQAVQVRKIIDQLFDVSPGALMTVCGDFNADANEVPMQAIRGDVENTQNAQLATRVLVVCESSVPEPARFSLYHEGHGIMLDHVLASRQLLAFYKGTQIHNELLHDESGLGASDRIYPESDHAPVVAEFELPN
ncbi:MAG: endonuclease/exonuclease/phosphatase family protein [Blastocatellales bacterium]